ncbi:hypothetical protein [Bacillus sp. Marseille-Q3570]|nr:hypothetical protein [Bacillus sp. Marseille-Q3570]
MEIHLLENGHLIVEDNEMFFWARYGRISIRLPRGNRYTDTSRSTTLA